MKMKMRRTRTRTIHFVFRVFIIVVIVSLHNIYFELLFRYTHMPQILFQLHLHSFTLLLLAIEVLLSTEDLVVFQAFPTVIRFPNLGQQFLCMPLYFFAYKFGLWNGGFRHGCNDWEY